MVMSSIFGCEYFLHCDLCVYFSENIGIARES